MTVANIDAHCVYVGQFTEDDEAFRELLRILEAAPPGSFEDGFVRVKLSRSNAPDIYIDNSGGVRVGTSEFGLDRIALARTKRLLEANVKQKRR